MLNVGMQRLRYWRGKGHGWRMQRGQMREVQRGNYQGHQIGPCYNSSQWGHLTRACPKTNNRDQLVVSAGSEMCGSISIDSSIDSGPQRNVVPNTVSAMHQSHASFLEAGNKGHNLASINVKGQAVGVDGTVQQLLKGVDGLGHTKDLSVGTTQLLQW